MIATKLSYYVKILPWNAGTRHISPKKERRYTPLFLCGMLDEFHFIWSRKRFFFAKKLRKNVQSTIMQYLFCLNRAMETVVCLRLKILYQTQTVRLLIPVYLCFHLFENFGPNSLQKPLEKLKIFNQML